jgi:uncharacterized protein YdeI (YjbR/CyaY-like superfamily)
MSSDRYLYFRVINLIGMMLQHTIDYSLYKKIFDYFFHNPFQFTFFVINRSIKKMNPKVDFFFNKIVPKGSRDWRKETEELRRIVLSCGLQEELKWGVPCYIHQKNNIVLIHSFKEYCALLFFKGALLKDPEGILTQQSENVQAARQLRFTNVTEIIKLEADIKTYIFEAVEVEKAGLKVELKKTSEFKMSEEFQLKLDESVALKAAFENLTPGRQRAYLLHFSSPKQSKTRVTRV